MATIDLSPADSFKQRRIPEGPFLATPVPIGLAEYTPDQIEFDRVYVEPDSVFVFAGRETDNIIEAAKARVVVMFNKRFAEWCASLPQDSEIFWRRTPVVEVERDFASGENAVKVYARASAFRPRHEKGVVHVYQP